jgi:hypothetical protein
MDFLNQNLLILAKEYLLRIKKLQSMVIMDKNI